MTIAFGTPTGIAVTALSLLVDKLLARREKRALPTGLRALRLSLLSVAPLCLCAEYVVHAIVAFSNFPSPSQLLTPQPEFFTRMLTSLLPITGVVLTASLAALAVRLLFGKRIEQAS